MNMKIRYTATDSIFTNNANRKFCTKYGISTSFIRKERTAKNKLLRRLFKSELSKEKATQLKSNFDTQKQHYSLSRTKTRNKKMEILWIFHEIYTAIPYR